MKRWIRPLLLLALLVSVLTVSAAAAEPSTDGIYGVNTSSGCTITPKDVEGNKISVSANYDQKNFYADAVKFDVTCSGLSAGEQYLLLVLSDKGVPTDGNIVYINQTAADSSGTVTFDGLNAAYPSKLEKDTTYYVYVVGADKAFTAGSGAVATFQYYQAYTLGDVDENGSVQVGDAVKILESVVGKTNLTKAQELAADVNKDGNVQVGDAVKVLEFVVGKITSFD